MQVMYQATRSPLLSKGYETTKSDFIKKPTPFKELFAFAADALDKLNGNHDPSKIHDYLLVVQTPN